MKKLHDLLEGILEEKFGFAHIATKLTERKLKEMGITLSNKQLKEVEKHFEHNRYGLLSIPSRIKKDIKLQFTEDDLDKLLDEMNEKVQKATIQFVEDVAERLFVKFKKNPRVVTKPYEPYDTSFNKNVKKIWGNSLDILRSLITISLEAGIEFNESFRQVKPKNNIHKNEALLRLHARACQIASEVHALLCAGYADGAHARWRSIHEVATVVMFIARNTDELAEQYLLHDGIESYKAMILYQRYSEKLNFKPISKREIKKIEKTYTNLLEQFGPNYKGDYGWASKFLGKATPKFRDIEEAVGLDYLRPYYKMASHNVHANPKGIFYKLGLFNNRQDIMLAGPSDVGFTDPAQCTALSLTQITISLLLTDPDLDRLVACALLMKLEREIGDCFFEVENKIKAIS